MACSTSPKDEFATNCKEIDEDIEPETSRDPPSLLSMYMEPERAVIPSSIPKLPESEPVWPNASRNTSILQPLSFPEAPRKDLSLFTDPSKDQPIYCLVCDKTFSSSDNELVDRSEQCLVQSETKSPSGTSPAEPSTKTLGDEDGIIQNVNAGVDVGSGVDLKKETLAESDESVRGKKKGAALKLEPKDEWLRHLLLEHKIVVHRMSDICSLKSYSEYWRSRLKSEPITNLVPVVRTNSLPTDLGPSEDYYLFSDALPEDKELRQQLQRRRLEAVLEVQQAERKNFSFSHKCLFCREMFTGNRALLFQHMLDDHSFNVGQPDNLVFVKEFLNLLQRKLDSLQCLYCERTFRDHATLKDHMRKKQHKKINAQNKVYDCFYVINYLELGKGWEQVLSEDDREIIGREDNEWGDWEEPASCSTHCLFCQRPFQDFSVTLHHMITSHNFDFVGLSRQKGLDYYNQVKVVNYIRRQVHLKSCVCCSKAFKSSEQLLHHMTCHAHFSLTHDRSQWDQPQYLFPLYENDAFLFALDDHDFSTHQQ